MTWIPLNSTSLHSARYQKATSLLELVFADGAMHAYFPVPERTFAEFLGAESQGRYFNLHIRKQFPHYRIRPANQPDIART
jgi:hypothetical protein